jgi:putative sigma-54 modulation protein
MKIDIKATNFELTPSITTYIDEKVGSLEKFINISDKNEERNAPVEVFVEVARTTNHHKHGDIYKAELNMKLKGELLRVDVNDWDLRAAVDAAKDLMERKIVEEKEFKNTKKRKGERVFKRIKSISPLAWFRKER